MINTFFSALIAIFFLGKSTKDVNEKTRNSSWFRTSVYFILTIIFGIVFYKSYQVKTIVNTIDIKTLRGFEDSLHHSKDTVKNISIYNNFETWGSYYNQYFDIAENDTNYKATGGFGVDIKFAEKVDGFARDREGLTNMLREDIENQTKKSIDSYSGSIFNFKFFSTNIPSLIHVYPTIRYDIPKTEKGPLYTSIERAGNVHDYDADGKIGISKSDPSKGLFVDGLLYQKTLIINDEDFVRKELSSLKMGMPHSLANVMNIFTAGDLSQYTYCIELKSDMYIESMDVVYNVPIEIPNQIEHLTTYANGFGIRDADILNKIVGQPMMFLVKLPSMANLQQIRSLVLTAIVTAFLSLFFTNLFYRIRKGAMEFKRKHNLAFSVRRKLNRNRVQSFKIYLYTIVLSFLIILLIVVIMSALNFVFLIDYNNLVWRIIRIVACITAILIVLTYFIYKHAITPPIDKEEQKMSNNSRKNK